MAEQNVDKKDIMLAHLKLEADGLYLAYGEISQRLKLEEQENKDLKKKLKLERNKRLRGNNVKTE